MERVLSDGDGDMEKLINPSERKYEKSTFEIGKSGNTASPRFRANFKKLYLLVICIPLLCIILFLFVDFGALFHYIPSIRTESYSSQMREAELQALNLLNIQQSRLLSLWNDTSHFLNTSEALSGNLTASGGELSLSSLLDSFHGFRSELLNQIDLNKKIQKFLLSSHGPGNLSGADNSETRCQKVKLAAKRQTIEWKPMQNRYLFAICVSGQMSNHLICLEKHMFFAAILDRMLILPGPKFDYQYDRVIDIAHINECFGRRVVIPFDDFMEIKKHNIHINRVICYVADPPCFVDDEHVNKLKSLGISMGKLEVAWPGDGKPDPPKARKKEDILPKFSCEDEVLAIGDVFYANVDEDWVMQPRGPLEHKCKTIVQPSSLIVQTAQRFIQTFLGGNFVALHFRRYGFLKFCNAKPESCFFPIPQAADCILRVVERIEAPIVYLSTDAAESEINLLQSLVTLNGKMIPLFKRPAHMGNEKWDAYLWRNQLGGDDQVDAMLDKTICTMSTVFIGASGSTFTEDILRLRRDLTFASDCDEYLCQGEKPNFLVES